MSKQQPLFNERVFEQLTGHNILHDSKTAIIELVANSWDAGASRVDIAWPENKESAPFSIKDNGNGLARDEFSRRWMQIGYNRRDEIGEMVVFPEDRSHFSKRKAYGRNGLGRFAGFKFSKPYFVCTKKGEDFHSYKIDQSQTNFLDVEEIDNQHELDDHGTIVYSQNRYPIALSSEDLKTEIGMRFLIDPSFSVYVNKQQVSFLNIPDTHKTLLEAKVDDHTIEIIAIDIQAADKTTYHHGVAWHVNGRLVGDCSWKGDNQVYALDGRTTAAKRFTFIVKADCLDQEGLILPDWTRFKKDDPFVTRVFDAVHAVIKDFILLLSEQERKEAREEIRAANAASLRQVDLEGLELWDEFVQKVQEDCPTLNNTELENIAKILANLEASKSKYALLEKMSILKPEQLDDLDQILGDWTITMAKTVLDEIQQRLTLIQQLKLKVNDDKTDEVQELQPLFNQSLWIFGAEYETIEYTSNEGMTSVIQKLMKADVKGSRNRPDFAILPDGTCGLKTLPSYDIDAGGIETGVDRLVIVELKKPSVPIKYNEKNQPMKYIAELDDKSFLQPHTKITCFVLGKHIDRHVVGKSTEQDGRITIIPMQYQSVLNNAHARLFNLQKKVKDAPFMRKQEIQEFIARGEEARRQKVMAV